MVVRALCAEVGLGGGEFDVGEFFSACDALLRFGGQSIPGVEIVEIFLDHDVAAALEGGVFIADEHGLGDGLTPRIFGAVDEAEEVALARSVFMRGVPRRLWGPGGVGAASGYGLIERADRRRATRGCPALEW